ncbi:MAG: hypothetical protein EBS56_10710, partial [Planctomycetia bacterium]|nr:hypothetical protein [Planctomycetia bacterium]
MVVMLVMVALTVPASARAQNDWQYPDPYFGILEIEKSRSAAPAAASSHDRQRSPPSDGSPRRADAVRRPFA